MREEKGLIMLSSCCTVTEGSAVSAKIHECLCVPMCSICLLCESIVCSVHMHTASTQCQYTVYTYSEHSVYTVYTQAKNRVSH